MVGGVRPPDWSDPAVPGERQVNGSLVVLARAVQPRWYQLQRWVGVHDGCDWLGDSTGLKSVASDTIRPSKHRLRSGTIGDVCGIEGQPQVSSPWHDSNRRGIMARVSGAGSS